jgi:hypothetical protein
MSRRSSTASEKCPEPEQIRRTNKLGSAEPPQAVVAWQHFAEELSDQLTRFNPNHIGYSIVVE